METGSQTRRTDPALGLCQAPAVLSISPLTQAVDYFCGRPGTQFHCSFTKLKPDSRCIGYRQRPGPRVATFVPV